MAIFPAFAVAMLWVLFQSNKSSNASPNIATAQSTNATKKSIRDKISILSKFIAAIYMIQKAYNHT